MTVKLFNYWPLWFLTENTFMTSKRLVLIALVSRFSYARKLTRKHDCSRACLALAGELFFRENGVPRNEEIL